MSESTQVSIGDKQKRVLVIEDSKQNCDAIVEGLRRHGFEADGFTDPTECVPGYVAGRYDLVVTELRLHKMSGFEVIRRVRRADPDVRLIALTAWEAYKDEFATLFPGLDLGGRVPILKKPFPLRRLMTEVDRYLTAR